MTVSQEMISSLIRQAAQAREKAYAPYSHFQVGAALLAEDGCVYTGCNVECVSYPITQCAERTALCTAVAQGKRKFLAIAVVGARRPPLGHLLMFALPAGHVGRCSWNFAETAVCSVSWQRGKRIIKPIG